MPITQTRRRNGVFSRRKNRISHKDGRSNTLKCVTRKNRVKSANTPCPTPKTPDMKQINENDYMGWYMCSRQSAIWDPKQFAVLDWETASSGAEADHWTTSDDVSELHFYDQDDLVEGDRQAFRDEGMDLLEEERASPEIKEDKSTLPRTNSLGKRNSLQMSEMVRQVSSPKRRKSTHAQNHAKAMSVEIMIPGVFRPNDKVRIIKGAKKQFLGRIARIEKYLISKDKWGLCIGRNKRIALGADCLEKIVPKHVHFDKNTKTNVKDSTPISRLSTVSSIHKYNQMCTTGYGHRMHRHNTQKLPFPMVAAIREERLDVIKALVMKNKCDINARNGLGQNALHVACQYDMNSCAKLLIEMGVDIDALDNTKHSALMIASKEGLTDIVAYLLAARANMNFQDCDGLTALMFACKNGHDQIVDLFLHNGAYIDLVNHSGQNALVVALASNHHVIAEKLMQAGLALDKDETSDAEAIHAITEGVDTIVPILVREQGNRNVLEL